MKPTNHSEYFLETEIDARLPFIHPVYRGLPQPIKKPFPWMRLALLAALYAFYLLAINMGWAG